MSFWTAALGGEIRFIDVKGVRTRYLAIGHGPDLVLLHGRGGHLEAWANIIPLLAPTFRVHAFDLGGHGLTDPLDAHDIEALTRHATDVLCILQLTRYCLAGQSIGGWIATRIALSRPDAIRGLALIEPAGLQSDAASRADPRFIETYQRGGEAFQNPTRDAVRARLKALFQNPEAIDDELLETRWRLYQPERARRVHLAVRQADNSAFLLSAAELVRLRMPVLFIRGEHSHTSLAVVQAAAAACPGARIHTLSGAKQWPQYERASDVQILLTDLFTNRGAI